MTLRASIGGRHQADITKEWSGDFKGFVKALLFKVPVTEDKASAGWVCGVHFKPAYRHSENYVARHFLSLDYDHIKVGEIDNILHALRGHAFLAYSTWSHSGQHPRYRVWVPLSRGCDPEEFQCVSRTVAARSGIELAARESHTPCQFMYRPAQQKDVPFEHVADTEAPYLDVDKILGEYNGDWRDRNRWPRRQDNDELYDTNDVASPLEKPGLVGAFCRQYRIAEAIERFDLPYRPGSTESRWTYSGGSRADGAVAYDDDTKLHSYHDTDPARGQHNSYDLVRLHRFGHLDWADGDTAIEARPSTRAMEDFCRGLEEFRSHFDIGLGALEEGPAAGSELASEGSMAALPEEITRAAGRSTDLENARRIQRAYGRQVLAVADSFYIWQETHWKHDLYQGHIAKKISHLSELIREERQAWEAKLKADGLLDEPAQKKLEQLSAFALKCEDKTKMDACRELCRKLLVFPSDKLNRHKHLLNARNCTIDLRTGETYLHRQDDFLTECAPTDYDKNAQCPRFERFIAEIFDGDEKLMAFMKRWLGYCATGETKEQALVFHVGKSGNGKSTLLGVMAHVLGGYASVGPPSLLTGEAQIKNDVATLVGKRLVTVNETKQNEEFDQAQLKQLTGGDKIAARFLHKEFFEFNPTHKLQVFTNHEPNFTGDDAGVWRRILLVRYKLRYGTAEQVATGEYQKLRDNNLDETLKTEAAGILRWLVEGARDWYANGLCPPAAVLKDTADLRSQQDLMAQFLKERTVSDPKGRVPFNGTTESLYTAYKGWMSENGHRYLGRNKFRRQLKDALPVSVREGRWQEKGEWFQGFLGIRLARNGEVTE